MLTREVEALINPMRTKSKQELADELAYPSVEFLELALLYSPVSVLDKWNRIKESLARNI